MITFSKLPQKILDPKTGKTTGFEPKPAPPTIGAMPIPEFHKQVIGLADKKMPLEKAFLAIEKHPDIDNKEKAKQMASAVYTILGKK